jgi:hypothetical protein
MRTIEPLLVWEDVPWMSPCCAVGDYNGDGRNELLFVQSAGAHANSYFDPRVDNGYAFKTGVEDQELFCMTLADMHGNILWQVGEPWAMERPHSWNGHWSEFCECVDINADGRPEIVLVHKGELRIYDGASGGLIRTRELPNQAFTMAYTVRADLTGRYHIFTKSGSNSATHRHGNPSLLLDSDLNTVWELSDIEGAGHRPNFADFDGDGLTEIVIGFGLYRGDGTRVWESEPAGPGDHLDDSAVGDIDGDGQLEVVFAHDGHAAVAHNADGSERLRIAMHHCQSVDIGKYFDNVPGQQILCVDKPQGGADQRHAVIVDADGTVINRHQTLGYYQPVDWRNEHGPVSFVCCQRPVDVVDGAYRAHLVDPTGAVTAEFAVDTDFSAYVRSHIVDRIRPSWAAYFGATHCETIGDIDDDGQDEVIIRNREKLWIFKME